MNLLKGYFVYFTEKKKYDAISFKKIIMFSFNYLNTLTICFILLNKTTLISDNITKILNFFKN